MDADAILRGAAKKAWKISLQGKYLGPFPTKEQAIWSAVDAARKAGQSNPYGAEILVPGRDHKFRVEWTYGESPYPLRG